MKKYILDQDIAAKKLKRMALEIIENNAEEKQIILAGIKESGNVVAQCIGKLIANFNGPSTEIISVSLDKKNPSTVTLSSNRDFNDQVIVVIDDVANSGRTLLYAMKPFIESHPKKIQTLVLVERSHNNFPIRPDYVGLSLATTLQEHIVVEFDEEKVLGAYLQ